MNAIPKAQAARVLGIDPKSLNKLVDAGLLQLSAQGRVLEAGVTELESQLGVAPPVGHPPILQVVKNPKELGASMYLSNTAHLSGAELAKRNADLARWKKGAGALTSNTDFTGYWEVSDENMAALLNGGIVISTVVGFASEAARVVREVERVPYRRRVVIQVERMSAAAAAPYLVHYPGLVRLSATHH